MKPKKKSAATIAKAWYRFENAYANDPDQRERDDIALKFAVALVACGTLNEYTEGVGEDSPRAVVSVEAYELAEYFLAERARQHPTPKVKNPGR